MNETLVLSIWIRILVPNFPSTTAWDHTSDPSSKSAMYPNDILAVGCILIGSKGINNLIVRKRVFIARSCSFVDVFLYFFYRMGSDCLNIAIISIINLKI
jgi:hypothetical protein